jgi:hypothetical protein
MFEVLHQAVPSELVHAGLHTYWLVLAVVVIEAEGAFTVQWVGDAGDVTRTEASQAACWLDNVRGTHCETKAAITLVICCRRRWVFVYDARVASPLSAEVLKIERDVDDLR